MKFTPHAGHASWNNQSKRSCRERGEHRCGRWRRRHRQRSGTLSGARPPLWASSSAVLETVWPDICNPPKRREGAIEILNQNVIHRLDYGKINGKPFFCTCGMGFDAFVSKKFADSGKRGLLQYAKNTIGVGLTYQSEHYILEYKRPEGGELDAFLIACANASQYGNNAYIAPTASTKDGLMDVIVMKPFPTIGRGPTFRFTDVHQDITEQQPRATFPNQEAPMSSATQPGAVHIDGDRHDGLRH